MDLVRHATEALFAAYRGVSKLPPEVLALAGFSSPAVRHLLNNLCDFPGCRYLEIGTWQGSTALAASYLNPGSFVAVDNFSQFDGPRRQCLEHRDRWRGRCRFDLVDADAWALDPARLGPVNVYFYDGGHAEDEQFRAFARFDPILADPFIAVVDDWNWPQVRHGTRRAFAHLGYHPAATWELRSPGNRTVDGWWNGLLLAVIHKRERP